MSEIWVVPPEKKLLETVAEHLLQRGHLSEAVVIFPHRRAVKFFEYYLSKKLKAPCLLPHLKALEDWVKETFVTSYEPKTVLEEYDQAWVAYQAAKEAFSEDGERITWEDFSPWALRLVKLFKELDQELIEARDILSPERLAEDLPERALKLLQKLGKIYQKFDAKLAKEGFTTPAKMLRSLAEDDAFLLPETPVYLVGFYALSRAESRLFRKLYENGAHVYWQAEIENLPEFYQRWKGEWEADLKPVEPASPQKPEIFFFEAHDLHAELKELARRLPEKITDPRPDACAVVLLSQETLIPLIHFLPEGPVNISTGYPLRLTNLSGFLKSLFTLILRKDERRGYPAREFLEFLKNPYLRELSPLEKELREYGASFVSQEEIVRLAENLPDGGEEIVSLLKEVIVPVEEAQTPADLSRALRNSLDFVRKRVSLNVLEKEIFASISETIFPTLETSLFSREPLDKRWLFRLFEELIASVRIPFEGEALCGLQILGLLETRLLTFDEVFFLDVNEGVLPDVEEVNPLLPRGIREALGLPDRQKEEAILRYHFERLLKGARKVHLFWQLQTTPGEAGLEGKKVRSRFVEKIIWETEKQRGKLFREDPEILNFKRSTLEILPEGLSRPEPLKKDEQQKEFIKKELSKISPTLLITYLQCPLQFFYSKALRLSPPEEPEELAYNQLGTTVHEALEEFFREVTQDHFPAKIKKDSLDSERLFEIFKQKIEKKQFYRLLAPEKRFFLLEGARFRLERYLKNHPSETEIIELEKKCSLTFELPGVKKFELCGKIDRIDRRDGLYVILDYKTGKITESKFSKALELDVSPWLSERRFDEENLREILRLLPDIQLPFYVYLFVANSNKDLWGKTTAAYVKLRENGEEVYFIKSDDLDKIAETYGDWLKEKFPKLIEYLVRHILEAPRWYPAIDEQACAYCVYLKMCRYGT